MNEPLAPENTLALSHPSQPAVRSNKRLLQACFAVLFAAFLFVCVAASLFYFGKFQAPEPRFFRASFFNAPFKFTDLDDALQTPTSCEPSLDGICSSSPGICVAFAFINDTEMAAVRRGWTGEKYQCGSEACSLIGRPCVCGEPAIRKFTHFARRAGASFACQRKDE